MTSIYPNFYDHFLSKYCRKDKICVVPCKRLIQKGPDQSKVYVNVNRRLANFYGRQKINRFNQAYSRLTDKLGERDAERVNEVVRHWLKRRHRRRQHFDCRGTCRCGPPRKAFHANPRCNWCRDPCRKKWQGSRDRNDVSSDSGSDSDQGRECCSNFRERRACGKKRLKCRSKREHTHGYDIGHRPSWRRRPTWSSSIQREILDCLSSDSREIRELVGDVVRFLL